MATETWKICVYDQTLEEAKVKYRADGAISPWIDVHGTKFRRAVASFLTNTQAWHPARYMHAEFSRIRREIVEVRAERLQDITYEGYLAEGWVDVECDDGEAVAESWFATLWDSINTKRGYPWSSNPWTWRLAFKKAEA